MKTTAKLSKCIAILLLVTLFMGMVPTDCVDLAAAGLAALAEEATARAAAKPASDLTTDDSGWIYRICADGDAEVLGHADASAEKLSIPYALGGAWVTRIGENAFAENAALKSIFIPGSITEIADTAFSGSSELVVRAYNGADALKFAQKRGFSEKNLSEYDFFDEVIDLSELKSAQWSLQGNARLSISAPWAQRIEVGSKLYIPPCRQYEKGLPVEVAALSESDGGVSVRFSQINFMDAVEKYYAEDVKMSVDADNIVILADGFELMPTDGVSAADTSVSVNSPLRFKVGFELAKGVEVNGVVGLEIEQKITVGLNQFKLEKLEIQKKSTTEANIEISASKEIFSRAAKKKITFAKIPMTSAGLISVWVSVGLELSVDGTVEVVTSITTTENYSLVNGRIQHTKSKQTKFFDISVKVELTLELQSKLTLNVGFTGSKLSIDVAELEVALGISGSTEFDSETPECVDVGVTGYLRASLMAGILNYSLDSKEGTRKVEFGGEVFRLEWKIWEGHWEMEENIKGKFVEKCTRKPSVKVDFYSLGTICDSVQCEEGTLVTRPADPVRAGYVFLGWARTPSGANLWDFDNDYAVKDMNLYAAWKLDEEEDPEQDEETDSPTQGTPEESESLGYLEYHREYNYEYGGYVVCITGYNGSPTALSIPKYIEDLPVRGIDSGAFENCSSLKSITIPDSATYIGNYAFRGCSNLTSIRIPNSVRGIGDRAFSGCSSLTSVRIPNGVMSIDYDTFSGCSSLKSITIPDSVTYIGWSAFYGCSSLTSVRIPNGVTSIKDDTFSGCSSLKSITIPDSVTYIGNYAFSGCSSLTSVRIPNGVTNIMNDAFSGCSSLTSISIGNSVTYIGNYTFSGCSSLTSVVIPNSVTSIEGSAFKNCSSLTSVTIPDSVTSIDYSTFYGCSSLESIRIPDSVTSIGQNAFSNCDGLESIRIPDSVTEIEAYTFSKCSSLESVTIPDSVTSIGEYAFDYCDSLQTLYTTPGSYAESYFEGEHPSVQIVYPDGTKAPAGFIYDVSNGAAAITGYNGSEMYFDVPEKLNGTSVTALAAESIPAGVRRITLPASVQHIDAQAFRWAEDLYTITVAEGNPNYYSVDGVLYAQNGTLVCYPRAKKADSFTPAEGTLAIGDYAFYGADKLGALNLGEGTTSIGSKAIYECAKLKTLSLPTSLKKLGDYAVYGCGALTRIDFAADPQSLGDGCFVGCGDELAMFGPLGANTLESHADTYLLNYNEYGVAYMMYGELLARVGARAGELLGEPMKPEDGEMSFKGWSQEENGALWDYEKDVMPEANITLYAVWKYDFSYEAVDGGVKLLRYTGDKHRIRVPESIDSTAVVEIAENCFEGLTEICLIGEKGGMAESFAANGGYDFEALTHTLSFRSNGGTYAAPRTLCATDVIEAPSVSRSNYSFLGWYTDENCSEAFDFTDGMPAADLTLYAGWEKIDANVSDVPFDFAVNETGLTIIAYTGQKHTVTIPEEINGVVVTEIGAHAFDGDQIIFTLKVPGSVTEIGEAAFADSRISEIIFESGLKKIGAHAFDSCCELQSVSLPDTLNEVGAYAFQDCMNLLKIELPSALKAIPEGMLAGCGFLEEVKLPAALESIGEAAFGNCDSLTNIELGANVCEVSPDSFEGCEALAEIEVSSANMYYRSVGGVLLSADGLKLICYPQGRKEAEYSVPSGVTALGDGSMAGSRIEKLVLNEELAYIGADALKGSRYLAELKIPSNGALSMIGEAAFQGCTALEELTLPSSLAAIEESAFDGCALKSVTFGGDTLLAEGAIPARSGLSIYGAHGWDAEDYAELYGIRYIDPKSDVPVTGIRLKAELTLERGEIARLEAALIPENSTETEISWSSSDASVAAVDAGGAVSGRYTGTAVITATAKDGSTASCTITVVEAQIKKLMLDRTEMSMALGDRTTLTASLSSGVSISVDWESDDAQIVSVENGEIRALRVGSATITASAYGCEAATCCVTVTAPEKLTGGLILPRALTEIGDEAFAGGEFESAVLPEGAESIGTRAFADCAKLQQITIPASVNSIAPDAFDGCEVLVIFCTEGSEVERYAVVHGLPCAIEKN